MDEDRVKGAVNQAAGSVKEAAGKVTGDTKTEMRDGPRSGIWVVLVVQQATFARSTVSSPRGI
jgi:hypothetical protein